MKNRSTGVRRLPLSGKSDLQTGFSAQRLGMSCQAGHDWTLVWHDKLFSVKTDDVQDYAGCLFHAFERYILHLSVEVVAAGEDVRTWQTHE